MTCSVQGKLYPVKSGRISPTVVTATHFILTTSMTYDFVISVWSGSLMFVYFPLAACLSSRILFQTSLNSLFS